MIKNHTHGLTPAARQINQIRGEHEIGTCDNVCQTQLGQTTIFAAHTPRKRTYGGEKGKLGESSSSRVGLSARETGSGIVGNRIREWIKEALN